MDNARIARQFRLLGQLMELHGENAFKIRSYSNAYRNLRKLDQPLAAMSDADIKALPGVGSAIAAKIRELLDTGEMKTLEKYRAITPSGVEELLQISGFGPKKVATVWKDLNIQSPGELLYACYENRLVTLKGFGEKTQAKLIPSLQLYLQSVGKYRYADIEPLAHAWLEKVQHAFPEAQVQLFGDFRRQANIIEDLVMLVSPAQENVKTALEAIGLSIVEQQPQLIRANMENDLAFSLHFAEIEDAGLRMLELTGSEDFVNAFKADASTLKAADEQALFHINKIAYVPPALRESATYLKDAVPTLVEVSDIKGVLHAHSTYSDGRASLRDMALACIERGYQYLGISDHSRIAVYANGLPPERVKAQWQEVDQLNAELAPFRIFKGIEADILADGDLDYDMELLQGFDFVIASVHSNLGMNQEKAMERLLRAIAHPCTRILGHPTGRLLLSRPGYSIDHKAIIEACATYGVAIELNANPYRLDLDWRWIPYAVKQGVKISINPDAHSLAGIDDIRFGILSAQKGGLTAKDCLTALGTEELELFFKSKQ